MRYGKIVVSGTLLSLGATLGAFYVTHRQPQMSSPPYTLARATRGDVIQVVSAVGQLSPTVTVEISTQNSGLVTEVNVDFNSTVRKGDVLARIDQSTYEQRVKQAEADLAAAISSSTLVAIRLRRLKSLLEQDLIQRQDFDTEQASYQQARATLIARRAALENAKLDLHRCTIVSPIDGIVIYKQVEPGKTVVSNFSAPTLFVIAQSLSAMRIVAPIGEVDINNVRVDYHATFTIDAIPGKTFEGRISQLRNPYTSTEKQAIQGSTQNAPPTFDAVINVDNSELLLRPSQTANISIQVAQRKHVLVVPNTALRWYRPSSIQQSLSSRSDDSFSIVYKASRSYPTQPIEAVKVGIGMSDSFVTEILSGLHEGDSVVTGFADASVPTPSRGVF